MNMFNFTDVYNKIPDKTKSCKRCKGEKQLFHNGFTALDGTVYPDRVTECYACHGKGSFDIPNLDEICNTLIIKRKGRLTFRASKPKQIEERYGTKDRQIYYVWRLVRFHAGLDVTMPVCAQSDNNNNPWLDLLDGLVDVLAKKFFGTNMAAAYRWGGLLGNLNPSDIPDGQPASAYPSGPVADENKPEEEQLELI